MLYVTRNFLVDRTARRARADAAGRRDRPHAHGRSCCAYLWVRPGMFRKIAGAWLKFFLPGFHPWNEDDRALLSAYDSSAEPAPQARRKVRRAV